MALAALVAPSLRAQKTTPYRPAAVTAEQYSEAERFLGTTANDLVLHGSVRPTWVDGTRVWYSSDITEGSETILVDVRTGRRCRDVRQGAQPRMAAHP